MAGTTAPPAAGLVPSRSIRPREFPAFLAMAGIAFAEPVLTAFRDGADVFVLRGAEAGDVVAFTIIVVLGPPLALWGVLQVGGALLPSRRTLLRGSLLGLLAALVVVRALIAVGGPRPLVLAAAVAAGLALALALARWPAVDRWLTYLAVFPLLLGLGFVVTRPVSTLVFGGDVASIGPNPIGRPDPVVMLVLDELPTASLLDEDDRISAQQFPNLAALADDATWYRNHTSVSPSTPQAVPAILTGRLPTSLDTLPVAEEHPDNLFTALGGGYRMHVDEGATDLCPQDLCAPSSPEESPLSALLDDALALWSDQLAADEEERRGDFTVRQSDPSAPVTFNRFLTGVEAADGPRLDYHHSLYPHQPWFHLPSGLTYEAPFVAEGLRDPAYSWTDPPAAASGQQRHLLQARHADALVGQLIDRLRELDRYDDSLVVVTADHGVAFEAGQPVRGLADDNAEQVMWTPLLVKAPGQREGRIDERAAQTIDILPTIADHLDLDLAFPTDGRSLLEDGDSGAPSEDERVFFDWSLNQLPPEEDGLVRVDGRRGYADLLALPPPGSGADPDLRFYRFGRHADLVGRSVDELATGPVLDGEVRLDQQAQLESVDTSVPPLPVYLAGDIPGDQPVDVAVAVNGTVGGWGRTEQADTPGRQHFWAMVPSDLLADGANEVTVAVIDDQNGRTRLLRVPAPPTG
jgi:hypothetical protein